jgi:hypothetical protein
VKRQFSNLLQYVLKTFVRINRSKAGREQASGTLKLFIAEGVGAGALIGAGIGAVGGAAGVAASSAALGAVGGFIGVCTCL